MKINGAGNSLFTGVMGKNTYPNRTLAETFTENKEDSVKVTISEKGQENYIKSVQEITKDADSYDAMFESRDHLLEANLSSFFNYDFQVGGEVNEYRQKGVHLSTKEQAESILKVYAKKYDEIMQGINGAGEIHVEDKNSEKGYRILTKEEEIDALNDSYKKYADYLEAQAKLEPEIEKGLKEYIKKLSNIGVKTTSKAQSYLDDINLNKEDEINPEDISEKMLDAVSVFREQYMIATENKRSLSSLLSSIKIFGN